MLMLPHKYSVAMPALDASALPATAYARLPTTEAFMVLQTYSHN